MTPEQLDQIRRRWSRTGPLGEPRSDADYTDHGCRILLRAAWDDIDSLIAAIGPGEEGGQHSHVWDDRDGFCADATCSAHVGDAE